MMAEGAGAYRHVVLVPSSSRSRRGGGRSRRSRTPFAPCAPSCRSCVASNGPQLQPEGLDQGFTHCFIVSFDGPEGRDAYLIHPAHQAFCRRYLDPSLEEGLRRRLPVDALSEVTLAQARGFILGFHASPADSRERKPR